jgi:outer membrane protein assembly factor BamB
MLIVIVGVSLGCVGGLVPIGWSGGKVADGTLFVGSKEGRLVAINLADDSRLWAEPLKSASQGGGFGCLPTAGSGCGGAAAVAIYGTPLVTGELVYIAGYNGKIYAYNEDNLATRWVYPREGNLDPFAGGLVTDDGTNLYIAGSDGKLYALDAVTGDWLWEYETGEKIWATPALSDGVVYIGSFDKKLYAINAADGTLKWSYQAEGAIVTTPLVADGVVYFGSFDRHLYAVNIADGSLKWRFEGENWFWAMPLIHEGALYAGCLDDKVYVLNPASGAEIVSIDLEGQVASSPVAVDKYVVFATRKGVVFSIDTESNNLRQLADFEKDVNGPLTAHEDIVYVHTSELALERVNVLTGAILSPISLESQS